MKRVTISFFSKQSGYTEKAIRNKIDRGDWSEHHHWVKAPDGRILIHVAGIERWIEGAPA